MGLRIQILKETISTLVKDDFSILYHVKVGRGYGKMHFREDFYISFFSARIFDGFFPNFGMKMKEWYLGTWGECCGFFSDFSYPYYDFEMSFQNFEGACRPPF